MHICLHQEVDVCVELTSDRPGCAFKAASVTALSYEHTDLVMSVQPLILYVTTWDFKSHNRVFLQATRFQIQSFLMFS